MKFIFALMLLVCVNLKAQVHELGIGGGLNIENDLEGEIFLKLGRKNLFFEFNGAYANSSSEYSDIKNIKHFGALLGLRSDPNKRSFVSLAFGGRYLFPAKNPNYQGGNFTDQQMNFNTNVIYNFKITKAHSIFAKIYYSSYLTHFEYGNRKGETKELDLRFSIGYSYIFGLNNKSQY